MSQIKQHLKHFDAQKHNNTNRINICSKDNEIIIPKKKKPKLFKCSIICINQY